MIWIGFNCDRYLMQLIHLNMVVLRWLVLRWLVLRLLHSLLNFLSNGSIINDHCDPSCIMVVVPRWTTIPTAFATGSLFIVLLISCGIDGDNAEPVAQIRCVRIKRVFARCAHHLVTVFFLKGFNHVLVNERCDVKQVLNVGFDDVHHVFGIHALRTHERELNLYFLVNLLELQGAESVRLGALA